MTTGKKRLRVVKGSEAVVEGSKAVVGKQQRVVKGSKAGVEGSKAVVGKRQRVVKGSKTVVGKRQRVVKGSKAGVEGSKAGLFLPVLLTDIEHWYCVVVNLVDKRIEVLDSMMLKTTDKKVATVTMDHVGTNAIDVRKRLVVRLLLSPHNHLRDVVLRRLLK
ncbi:hypothetical protein C3L33_23346, partial [Rhododendron williamsianum]